MQPHYRIDDTQAIVTPALIVFRDLLQQNLDRMIQIAGDPARLCPHCKTHKMADVIHLQLRSGIHRFKCATLAEAEMLARAGARDVLLAYNLVGPNIHRAVMFRSKFPDVVLSVTADDTVAARALGAAMHAARLEVNVLLDLDTGQHRTGLPVGPTALALYKTMADTPGLRPTGLHVYDGQNHQASRQERRDAVNMIWNHVLAFRDTLLADGLSVCRIVAGGTGSFPIFAEFVEPAMVLSPGTCVFHDAGYQATFPDLEFVPAALLLTRVVSRPTSKTVTLDAGNKAVASDPPMEKRLVFPDLPDARLVVHNEEHLVIETSQAERLRPGDALLAIPWHICPTSALHREAIVMEDGRPVARWPVTARDRFLSI